MVKSMFHILGSLLLIATAQAAAPKPSAQPAVPKATAQPAGKTQAKPPQTGASRTAAAPAKTAAAQSTQPLDQELVKKYYGDGDFDPAVAILEDFQKSHATFSREESLMVYKYLGVMYCADQGTREKGKNYFYKLLKIDPDAKILDMYVSIVVQDIFKNTLDELMGQTGGRPGSSQSASAKANATQGEGREDRLSVPDNKPGQGSFPSPNGNGKSGDQAKIAGKKSYAAYWWIGGMAVAASVAGGYYVLSQSDGGHKGAESDIPVQF